MLSVSNWRTIRARLAPSDSRIQLSCCRAVARASSRFAMFRQAISRTSATTVVRTNNGWENSRRSCANPFSPVSMFSVDLAMFCFCCSEIDGPISSARITRDSVVSDARACASVTPGRRRPIAPTHDAVVRVNHGRPGISAGCIIIGAHRSTCVPTVSPKNSRGATPTIVNTVSSWCAFPDSCSNPLLPNPLSEPPRIRTVRPRMSGDAPKARCHKPWLITTTGLDSGARSSSGVSGRPSTVSTPSVEK